ncbi:glycerophosphoryl diester phosphodiesterase family protein [Litorimonas taeanensis]|uniref:Glycerophosphoryl diester phosphodiesterase family protein n=1 Tax=Litorimonas taeanensis TaxID=568099 RepID=A0A420WKB5_9PROT|nr:glycerophosphodiester phosphodiesterase [Litorimonas taeanensis]RKQ71345.1 glycerophosphoryl diester phosphodiesterase family protein [Litorimonas taeanensis]
MVEFSALISHRFRGFTDKENTIDGLNAALEFGVKQVEFDIRVTRCGTPLIYHDEHAKDAQGKTHHICDLMADGINALGGDFSQMPTAEALFKAIADHANKNCTLLIDIKDAGFEEAIYALVMAYKLENRVVWVSWLPEVLYALNDIKPDQQLCLSHWCRRPGRNTRAIHHVFFAQKGHIPRPDRKVVVGERSGWFVDGPLRGDLRRILTHVCVPAGQVWPELVRQYQRDNIKVSAFSYTDANILESESKKLKLNDYFSDNKDLFDYLIER